MTQRSRPSRSRLAAWFVAACFVATGSACRAEQDEGRVVPAGSVAPDADGEIEATVQRSSVPEPTVPPEPVALRLERMSLAAGWSYESRRFDVPLGFTVPVDDSLGRWELLFDSTDSVVVRLILDDPADPTVVREEPGIIFFALPSAVSPLEFVELWSAYAADAESFTAVVSDGVYLGSDAVVTTGTYDLGDRPGGFPLRLDDSMMIPVASGERTYVSYLFAVGDRHVMVQLNSHELDADLTTTVVNQFLESVEFR